MSKQFFESSLRPIGGPSKALAKMMEQFGACQIMNMFARISEHPESFSNTLEYFPTKKDVYNKVMEMTLGGSLV